MNYLFITLPGCGKTYATKRINAIANHTAIDFDIRGSKYLACEEVLHAQGRLMQAYFYCGADCIFAHNGSVAWGELDPVGLEIHIFNPDVDRLTYYDLLKKRGDSISFLEEAWHHFSRWQGGLEDLYIELQDMGFDVSYHTLGLQSGEHLWDWFEKNKFIKPHKMATTMKSTKSNRRKK